jgi:hypothetical protein
MKAFGLNRMFLHAQSVTFQWPARWPQNAGHRGGARNETGDSLPNAGDFSVNTPLPAELAATIDQLAAGHARARKR